jgi:hypothetical protein
VSTVRALALAAATVLGLSACLPITSPFTGPRLAPKAVVVGHSIPNSAHGELEPLLARTRLVAFDTAPGRQLTSAGDALDWAVAQTPDVALVDMGENDIIDSSPAVVQRRVRGVLDRLSEVGCVLWVDMVDERAGAPAWRPLAQQFNTGLRTAASARANTHVAAWSDAVRGHGDWLLEDDLHLSDLGVTMYSAFVAAAVDRFCGGPTASVPITSEVLPRPRTGSEAEGDAAAPSSTSDPLAAADVAPGPVAGSRATMEDAGGVHAGTGSRTVGPNTLVRAAPTFAG